MKTTYEINRTLTVDHVETEVPGVYIWRSTTSEDGQPDIVHEGIGEDLPTPCDPNPATYVECTSHGACDGGLWRLYRPEAFDILRLEGYSAMGDGKYEYKVGECASATPYTDRDAGLVLARDYARGHRIYRPDGTGHPAAVRMDYIEGRVRNGDYNLPAALEALKGREDVTDAKIVTIPWYNVDRGRGEALEWVWQPSDEDYQKYLAQNNPWAGRDFIRDLLGVTACRLSDEEIDAFDAAHGDDDEY